MNGKYIGADWKIIYLKSRICLMLKFKQINDKIINKGVVFMITKKNKVGKRLMYREILNKMSTHTNGMIIQGLLIDDNLITYELVDENKELDISIILKDDVGTFPLVHEIVITTSDNFNDIGIINNLLNMFD